MYDLNLKYKYNHQEINIFLTQGKLISKLY